MLRCLGRRLLLIPAVLLGLSIITFAVWRIVPGDPVKRAAGPQARPERLEQLPQEFGLDRPLPEQYPRCTTVYTGMLLLDTLIAGNLQAFGTAVRYMILPAFCQSLLVIALVTRQLRGDMLDILRKDFVLVARANGIPERIIWTRYLMKN